MSRDITAMWWRTAMMYYDHELISVPSNNDRALSDILCVVETADPWGEQL